MVDPKHLSVLDGKLTIDMFKAVMVNELAALGDRTIGTKPPLKLRFVADPSKPRSVGADGETPFTIGDVEMFSGQDRITDLVEREIAGIFMQYGDWECSEAIPILSGNELDAIEFTWSPREPANEGQGFEMIGTLSSMFSRYYAEQTLGDEGVIQTEAAVVPGWFVPLVKADYKGQALPLWRFILQPRQDL